MGETVTCMREGGREGGEWLLTERDGFPLPVPVQD